MLTTSLRGRRPLSPSSTRTSLANRRTGLVGPSRSVLAHRLAMTSDACGGIDVATRRPAGPADVAIQQLVDRVPDHADAVEQR
eukprot:1954993-Alexandrium_andersonii.AAC.1